MTEGYTDEELAAGVSWDPMKHGLQGLNELALRLGATIQRLLRERDEASAALKQEEEECERWHERCLSAERERDEARRVARVLSECAFYQDDCWPSGREAIENAVQAARAYPEVKP